MRLASGLCSWMWLLDQRNVAALGLVHLVEQDRVGALEVDVAREVLELVAGAQRVDDGDPEVGLVERRVVVAAVPDDDVGLFSASRRIAS
jgi:hypothetical protein